MPRTQIRCAHYRTDTTVKVKSCLRSGHLEFMYLLLPRLTSDVAKDDVQRRLLLSILLARGERKYLVLNLTSTLF